MFKGASKMSRKRGRSLTVRALIRDAVRESISREREMFEMRAPAMQGEMAGEREIFCLRVTSTVVR